MSSSTGNSSKPEDVNPDINDTMVYVYYGIGACVVVLFIFMCSSSVMSILSGEKKKEIKYVVEDPFKE